MHYNQLNPSAMFRKLKGQGFKGCIKSFTDWFDSRFPDYKFETGEISIEKQVVNELVQRLSELKEMQTVYHQFSKTINGDSVSDLEDLCESIKNTELKRTFSFFKGLKKDWDAICN